MLQLTALTKEEAEFCPIRSVLTKVTGKWQILILLALEDGELRFGALKRLIGDVTPRVLTDNLRSLERDGYVARTVHDARPVAVSYALTDLGRALIGVLKPLVIWAGENFDAVAAARERSGL